MKVLLISANTETFNMPIIPVGLGAIAAATLNAGHEVNLIDLMSVGDARLAIKEAMEGFEPDVVGISVRNIDDQNLAEPTFLLDKVREVISDCRRFSDAPIVLGGAGYSMFPESSLTYLGVDMGIQGICRRKPFFCRFASNRCHEDYRRYKDLPAYGRG